MRWSAIVTRPGAFDLAVVGAGKIEALGTGGGEHGLLDPRLVLQAELGRGVAETFRVLLADDCWKGENARRLQ